MFQAPEVPPAACCVLVCRRNNASLPQLSCSCLPAHYQCHPPAVLLPCILWPFGGVSKLTSCASSCRRMLWWLTLRFASPPPHIFLRAAQQHAVDRRGAAAYGDAHLLFGKRKCSFLLHLLLLFLWSHKQKCSAPRDMSIETLSSVWFGRSRRAPEPPPKM